MPQTGDVLYTTEGHTLESTAMLPHFEKIALAQHLIALQLKDILGSDYLLHIILNRFFNKVLRRSTGSAARGISSKQLEEIFIPLLPYSIQ